MIILCSKYAIMKGINANERGVISTVPVLIQEKRGLMDSPNITIKICCRKDKCIHPDGPGLPGTPEYFHRYSGRKDGLSPRCKECTLVYHRNHREELSQKTTKWQEDHPDRFREYQSRYYVENADKVRERQRRWGAENTDKRREYNRKYYAENSDKECAKAHRYRARKLGNGGNHTATDIQLQIQSQTNKRGKLICWWCEKPIKGSYHVDHRIPLARGGSNNADNIVIAHKKCNQSKKDKLPHEFNGRLL